MTKEKYLDAIRVIEQQRDNSLRELRKSYVKSIESHKIGDVIQGVSYRIKIKTVGIGQFFGNSYPEPVYTGVELTKKNTPKKNKQIRSIYQSKIIGTIQVSQ
jgi:hypothetical protein